MASHGVHVCMCASHGVHGCMCAYAFQRKMDQQQNLEELQKELGQPHTLQTGVLQYLPCHIQVFPTARFTLLSLINL